MPHHRSTAVAPCRPPGCRLRGARCYGRWRYERARKPSASHYLIGLWHLVVSLRIAEMLHALADRGRGGGGCVGKAEEVGGGGGDRECGGCGGRGKGREWGRAVECWVWWLSGKFGALRPDGRRFESHSSRYVRTLGKSFARSCCL